MKKVVITKSNNGITYTEFKNSKAIKADIFYDDTESVLGNIYVGHVRDIVKNINCAFVEYSKDKVAYLNLSLCHKPYFLGIKNTDKLCEGDRVIIQIKKEAVKTKDAVAGTDFDLTGRYAILQYGHTGISFSSKIRDDKFKSYVTDALVEFLTDEYGFLIRTNGYMDNYNDALINIKEDIMKLQAEYHKLTDIAKTRPKHYCLRKEEMPFVRAILNNHLKQDDCVITDSLEIFDELKNITKNIKDVPELKLYTDNDYPLYKLYSLEKIYNSLNEKKVWLNSGGYLIIEYTEALTVIDVNTGKSDKGKNAENTFFKINMEAAKEICRQLSLRNISGIIIIDFIDMKEPSHKSELFNEMKRITAEDDIKTVVVDYTKLHLMELTRRKTRDIVKPSASFSFETI